MKEIKMVKLDKYNSDDYEEIAFSIYLNKNANNYCMAFEADEIAQYPLEDLLDQYGVSCTEYYGQSIIIDGVEKCVAEVETLSNEKKDLIKILNFSTIAGREIINVTHNGYEILTLKYGMSNFVLNGNKIEVPIVAYRNDITGMISFEIRYPEMQYKNMFSFDKEINANLENFGVSGVKYILLKDKKAYLVYEEADKTYEAVFNLNGYETTNII